MNRAAAPGQTRTRRIPEACGLPGLNSLVQGKPCGKLRRLAIAISDLLARWSAAVGNMAWAGLPVGPDYTRQQTAEYRGGNHV